MGATQKHVREAERVIPALLLAVGGRYDGIERMGKHHKMRLIDADGHLHRLAYNHHPQNAENALECIVRDARRIITGDKFRRHFEDADSHTIETDGATATIERHSVRPTGGRRYRTIRVRVRPETHPDQLSLLPDDDSPSLQSGASADASDQETTVVQESPMLGAETAVPDAKKRNYLSFTQQMQVHSRLTQVIAKGEDGLVHYSDGLSDGAIAEEMSASFRCTESNVRSVREEAFGLLRRVAPPAAPGDRLDRLERLLSALCSRLGVSPEELLA